VPRGKSIEDLLQEALGRGDYSPLQTLAERLMRADYYLAPRLGSAEESNCCRQFFETFAGSHFLTFNYDSLLEAFLLRMRRWCPHDGYGVPVKAELSPETAGFAGRKSSSLVLHLHGALCLYTSEFEARRDPRDSIALLVPRERPRYFFDPDSVAWIFTPYEPAAFAPGRVPLESRIVAPVPEKAGALTEAFVRETYARARNLVRASGTLVAIGYSFGSHDRASYKPLLRALEEARDRRLFVVSPDAAKLATRLRREYCHLNVQPIEETLKGWAVASFRGVPRARGRERRGA